MNLKDKIEEKAFNFENEDGTFKESTIFLKDLYEISEIKQLLLHNVSQQRELLIDCVRTCLKDKESITIEQQVDTYLLNKGN